jgi:tetratricopeptide (TPR) repeat protein
MLVTGILCVVLAQTDPAAIDDLLRRAKNEYAYGNYDQAVARLHELLYPMKLTTDEQEIEARKYLGLAYYLLGKKDEASQEFGKLLFRSPDYELDPYAIAPPVIELFEKVRQKLKPELDGIRQRKSDDALAAMKPGTVRIIEQSFFEKSEFATLMPFGAGQFQNGDYVLGTVFALSEIVLLAINIGAYLWATSYGPEYREDNIAARTAVQRLTIAQYAAASLFGVVWSVGVFKARLPELPAGASRAAAHA